MLEAATEKKRWKAPKNCIKQFFLWVSLVRLSHREDDTAVGWLKPFYCQNTLPTPYITPNNPYYIDSAINHKFFFRQYNLYFFYLQILNVSQTYLRLKISIHFQITASLSMNTLKHFPLLICSVPCIPRSTGMTTRSTISTLRAWSWTTGLSSGMTTVSRRM